VQWKAENYHDNQWLPLDKNLFPRNVKKWPVWKLSNRLRKGIELCKVNLNIWGLLIGYT